MHDWLRVLKPSHNIAAYDSASGNIVGYGAMQCMTEVCVIQPVYADEISVGLAILCALLRKAKLLKRPVELVVSARNVKVYGLLRNAGLQHAVRMQKYGRVRWDVPFEKMVAQHRSWPI